MTRLLLKARISGDPFLKAVIPGGAVSDLFSVVVPVQAHDTKAGVHVNAHMAVRRKAPDRQPDAKWRNDAMKEEEVFWQPKVMQAPIPLFRSISRGGLAHLVRTGAVTGKGNSFAENRPHVFFSGNMDKATIGQGEDPTRDVEMRMVGSPLHQLYMAAKQRTHAANETIKAASKVGDKKAFKASVEAHAAASADEREARKVYMSAYHAAVAAERVERASQPFSSAIIETHPLGGGLHYSKEFGHNGMPDDEYGFPHGYVKASDVRRVHLVKDGAVIDTIPLEQAARRLGASAA